MLWKALSQVISGNFDIARDSLDRAKVGQYGGRSVDIILASRRNSDNEAHAEQHVRYFSSLCLFWSSGFQKRRRALSAVKSLFIPPITN